MWEKVRGGHETATLHITLLQSCSHGPYPVGTWPRRWWLRMKNLARVRLTVWPWVLLANNGKLLDTTETHTCTDPIQQSHRMTLEQ